MIKYRINGEFLDLFNNKKDFAVTKQVSKIGEINLRHGDFSTSFKVPLTANNARILRYVPELNHYTDVDSFDRFDGQLYKDEAVIAAGYFQIESFSPIKKEIGLKFLGGNADWFEILKGRYINKDVPATESIYPYDLNEFDHYYNYADTTATFSNTEGYIYFPFANESNMYKVLNDSALNVGDLAFGMYEHTLVKKIFDSIGIKLNGSLFSDPSYYKSIIPNDKGMLQYRVKETKDTYLTDARRIITLGTPTTGLPFNRALEDSNVQQWANNTYTAPSQTDTLRFYLYWLFELPPGTQYFTDQKLNLKIDYTINGVPQTQIVEEMQIGGVAQSATVKIYSVTYDRINTFTGVQKDDTFTFTVERTYGSSVPPNWTFIPSYSGQSLLSEFIITTEDSLNKVQAKNLLPSIKQSDYIKDILVRAGALTYYDNKTRTLTVNKFEDIDTKRELAPDWTGKIDLSKDIDTNFRKLLANFGQKSLFGYHDDSDKDNRLALLKDLLPYNLGTGALEINIDSIDQEKGTFTSIFSSTSQNLAYQNKFYMPYLPVIEGTEDDGATIYEDTEINPRVLLIEPNFSYGKVNNAGNSQISIINDDDELPVQILYDELPFAYFAKTTAASLSLPVDSAGIDSITETLNFVNYANYTGISLIERNYNLYNKVLNAPFYVSLYMNLSSLDVQQYNPFIPIFLKYQYDSGYYYIDSIEQYKGDGSTTKVNLIKI